MTIGVLEPDNIFATDLIGQSFSLEWRNTKYSDTVSASNGKLYFVPNFAKKVVSFDPKTNVCKEIGDDFRDNLPTNLRGCPSKWGSGVLVNNGEIFCAPCLSNDVLVIDTKNDTTYLIPLPTEIRRYTYTLYNAGEFDGKENVLFFPEGSSTKILKVNVNTKTISEIDIDFGDAWLCALRASDGYMYGISGYNPSYIVKYDPNNSTFERRQIPNIPNLYGFPYMDIVEHKDGNLYAIPYNATKVVKINMMTLATTMVGEDFGNQPQHKWEKCIIGNDGYIYGIPYSAKRVVRFDPLNNTTTLIGKEYDGENKWESACLANNGHVYCAPCHATRILKISIGRWHAVKRHVMIRSLVEKGRALSISNKSSDTRDEEKRHSCYHQFVQNTSDDVFRIILSFL